MGCRIACILCFVQLWNWCLPGITNIIPDAISRLRYTHLRRWFMCRLGLDCDNFDVTWLTRFIFQMSNESIMSIFVKSSAVAKCIGWRNSSHYRQLTFVIATKKSYASQLKSYLSFCNDVSCCPVPVTQANLLRYAAFLTRRLAPQSIPDYLNMVKLLTTITT